MSSHNAVFVLSDKTCSEFETHLFAPTAVSEDKHTILLLFNKQSEEIVRVMDGTNWQREVYNRRELFKHNFLHILFFVVAQQGV